MKKFIYICISAIVVIAIAIGCYKGYKNFKNTDDTSDSTEVTEPIVFGEGNPIDSTTYDFNKVITSDAQWCAMHYAGKSCNYYESTIILNQNIDEVDSTDIRIKAVRNVFQCGEYCVFFNHNVGQAGLDPTIEVYNDYYMECLPITLPVSMTVGDMISALNKCNCVKPHTSVCVIRKPLIPPFDGPYYIVGTTGTGFVKVRISDGNVSLIN